MNEILPKTNTRDFFGRNRFCRGKSIFPMCTDNIIGMRDRCVAAAGRTFAFFTNEHSGCYILTRDQLGPGHRFGRIFGSLSRRTLRAAGVRCDRPVHAMRISKARSASRIWTTSSCRIFQTSTRARSAFRQTSSTCKSKPYRVSATTASRSQRCFRCRPGCITRTGQRTFTSHARTS